MAKIMETINMHSNSEKGYSRAFENNSTLIKHTSKIFRKIVQKLLEQYLEREMPYEKSGFRENRNTRPNIRS